MKLNYYLSLAALIPAAILFVRIYQLDHIEKEPRRLLGKLVLFGALAAVLAALAQLLLTRAAGAALGRSTVWYLLLDNFVIVACSEELAKLGYETEEFAFTDSNDVASVSALAAQNCDVVYIPTDNTAAAYTETIANELIPAKIPAVVGEEGICKGCGVATLTISYYDIGYATGLMAYEILANGADISAMPIEYAPQFTKKYNAANAEALGLTIPADYTAIE